MPRYLPLIGLTALLAASGCQDLDFWPKPPEKKPEKPQKMEEIPPGHSAVTIRVTGNPERSGLLFPGVNVDVMATPKGGGLTEMVAEKVQVLALPRERAASGKGTPVTVAVTREQAEVLIQSQAAGQLTLLIRGD